MSYKFEVVEVKVCDALTAGPEDTKAMAVKEECEDELKRKESRIHITCGDFHVDIDEGADKATLRDTLSILQKIC